LDEKEEVMAKRPKTPPKGLRWHDGERYDVAFDTSKLYHLDQEGYRTVVPVWIFDKALGKTLYRRGRGEQIGSFHPVWVTLEGEKVQVEELLRRGDPLAVRGRHSRPWSGFAAAPHGDWYTIVWAGSGPYTMPPRGPWKRLDDAYDALARWRTRAGHLTGTIEAAHNVRVVGPFATRAQAREADISTAPPVSRCPSYGAAPSLTELAEMCKEIIESARADLGYDLGGFSMLDLVADNIPGVPLRTLDEALVVAGFK
jgi:hypothetical protein